MSRLVIVRQFFTASARFFNPYEAMVPVASESRQRNSVTRTGRKLPFSIAALLDHTTEVSPAAEG